MTRKHLMTLAIVTLLLVSFFGTAAAQAVETPTPEPTAAPVEPTSKFFSHPVVQILSAYFGRPKEQPATDPNAPTATPVDPNATPVPTETPVDPVEQMAEEIAAYHEDGMGFGVLVKLYAMAEASQEACPTTPTTPTDPAVPTDPSVQPACTAVTVDELVNSFRSGTGMGQLFKQYGKPALLGVGHARKLLKSLENAPTAEPSPVVTGLNKGHKPDKGPHGNGNGKNK